MINLISKPFNRIFNLKKAKILILYPNVNINYIIYSIVLFMELEKDK